jgi:uncharacterized membrane protein YbhN (UPF0104 family)
MATLASAGSGTQASAGDTSAQAGKPRVHVQDHLEPIVRIPADLLRCVIAAVEIALLIGIALLATQTATGVDVDVVSAGHKLPGALLHLIGWLGSLALWVLPAAVAIRFALLKQFRKLVEAVLTGGVVVGIIALANLVLGLPALSGLYVALHTTVAGASHGATLDAPLAGLVAYVTVLGLRGHAHWRPTFLTAIVFYGLTTLVDHRITVISLLITVLAGSAIGSGLRYALGTNTSRPTAADIAIALSTPRALITSMRRLGNGGSEVRRYAATSVDGQRLDVTVFDRDQQGADAFYRLYRRLHVKTNVSRSAPLTLEAAIERQALLRYATEDAGVQTPRLRAAIRVGPDAVALATSHLDGITLAESGTATTDDQLRRVWDTVLRLHAHRVTHRALTADRIMLLGDGRGDVALLDPGNGDVAATELQFRLDLVQLIAQTALLVGSDRAASLAIEKVGPAELRDLVPLLQPVALFRSTRAALRHRKDLLADLRKRLLAAAPEGPVPPVQLERISARTLVTLIAGVFAAYVLAGQLADVQFSKLLAQVNPGWTIIALALSAATYLGATLALSGFVLERLRPLRTFLVQVAGSFVVLVTPPAVGGLALNVRYLRKAHVDAADAAASVGVTQVISFLVYVVLVLISATVAGTTSTAAKALTPPKWVYIGLGVIGAIALIILALPAGRRQLVSRVSSLAGRVIPRLVDVGQRPTKLVKGVGGSLLTSIAYILCLDASLLAVGERHVQLASVAVVFLTASAIGSILPIPGGIGAVEGAMSLALSAAGVPYGTAITAVLLFRTVTFWLPAPVGWLALHYLQRRDVL